MTHVVKATSRGQSALTKGEHIALKANPSLWMIGLGSCPLILEHPQEAS